jgi:lysozyme
MQLSRLGLLDRVGHYLSELKGGVMAFPAGAQPGIDVSHYQAVVDWSAVNSAGDVFAYPEASEGGTISAIYFADNRSGITAAGMLRGAYHLFHPSTDPNAQANFFLQQLANANGGSPLLAAGDLPAALDLEVTDAVARAAIVAGAGTWLATVQGATGRQPVVYTYPRFWNDSLGNPRDLAAYPLWIAHLNVAAPTVPGGWANWVFWQFDKQIVSGAPGGAVDLDAFNGTLRDLQTMAGLP